MAFFMHTLFREENDRDTQAMKYDQAGTSRLRQRPGGRKARPSEVVAPMVKEGEW